NRHSLTTSYLDLMSHSGTSLTQSVARAMLRFVTVTAEALRFRQIQRGFRTTLDDLSGRSYVMTAEDVDLTLNWGRLSSVLPDYHGQDSVRVGRISFGSVNAILGSVALILNCHHHASRVARMA
ncbi:ribosome-inactivating family protein, partial [Klebsiella pneumoniae]|nr:ribosome-inactivating family protein [Klebsiella pneumoniae]